MKHSTIIILLSICTLACNRESQLFQPNSSKEYSLDTLTSIRLKSEQVGISCDKARDIFVLNPYIILLTDDDNGYVKIYSTKATLPTSICQHGRANNEFVLCESSGQFGYNPSGEILMYLQDLLQMKIVNITQSLEVGRTVVEKMVDAGSITESRAFMRDTAIIFKKKNVSYEDARDYIYEPATYFWGDSGKGVTPYKIVLKNDNFPTLPLHVYSSTMRLSPDQTKVVEALSYLDFINIFDLERDSILGLRRKGAYSLSDIEKMSVPELEANMKITNTSVCVTGKYIMVLRSGKPAIDNDGSANELIIFDWKGTLFHIFDLDNAAISISYDDTTDNLYYLNEDGEVFKTKMGIADSV